MLLNVWSVIELCDYQREKIVVDKQHKRVFGYERKTKNRKGCCVALVFCCLRVCTFPVHDEGVVMLIETT